MIYEGPPFELYIGATLGLIHHHLFSWRHPLRYGYPLLSS
jgi:hypothetical protein